MIDPYTFSIDFMDPGLDLLVKEGGPSSWVDAQRLLLAIAIQESGLTHRKQIGGPARGWWQFEAGGGVAGVMTHPATKDAARAVCDYLHIPFTRTEVYEAIAYNNEIDVAFARLLLYPDPHRLPERDEEDKAWAYYIRNWRPGKPDRARWSGSWDTACGVFA